MPKDKIDRLLHDARLAAEDLGKYLAADPATKLSLAAAVGAAATAKDALQEALILHGDRR